MQQPLPESSAPTSSTSPGLATLAKQCVYSCPLPEQACSVTTTHTAGDLGVLQVAEGVWEGAQSL